MLKVLETKKILAPKQLFNLEARIFSYKVEHTVPGEKVIVDLSNVSFINMEAALILSNSLRKYKNSIAIIIARRELKNLLNKVNNIVIKKEDKSGQI